MPVRELQGAPDRLLIEAELPADPMVIFDHLVRPELLALWWAPAAQIDPRQGGEYALSWPAQGWTLRGHFTQYEPDERLAYTWRWDHEPDLPERLVTIVLAPAGAATLLALSHSLYGSSPAEQADRDSHRQGWLHFLGRLEESLASQPE
jgi:uncharacterized protein YndB with AHSA1/START domain